MVDLLSLHRGHLSPHSSLLLSPDTLVSTFCLFVCSKLTFPSDVNNCMAKGGWEKSTVGCACKHVQSEDSTQTQLSHIWFRGEINDLRATKCQKCVCTCETYSWVCSVVKVCMHAELNTLQKREIFVCEPTVWLSRHQQPEPDINHLSSSHRHATHTSHTLHPNPTK